MADDVSICPRCDYIIDASFLSDEPPESDDDPTSAQEAVEPDTQRKSVADIERASGRSFGQAPPARGARPSTSSSAPERSSRGAPSATPPRRGAPGPQPRRVAPGPETDARPPPPRARRSTEYDDADDSTGHAPSTSPVVIPGSGGVVAPEQALVEARDFVRDLPGPDKLAFVGAGLTILCAFMPWKDTAAEGEILGLMSAGVVAVLASALCLAAIVVRRQGALPRLSPLVPWVTQLGACAFTALFCLVFMKLSYDPKQVAALDGNITVASSRPSFGVFLGFCSAVLAVVGTLMGLRQRAPTRRYRK